MKTRLKETASWLWDQRYRIPLTGLGTVVGGAALWLRYGYGAEHQDVVLRSGAAVVLLLLLTAVALVLTLSLVLWLRLRRDTGLEGLELESGVQALTGYSFPRFAVWPMVQIRVQWANPRRVKVSMERTLLRFQELVEPEERGNYERVRRRFIVSDIFGLARLGVSRDSQQPVRILPGPARVGGHVVTHLAGGDGISHPLGPSEGDLLDMRRYAPGDPLRLVLWRAFARTRQLLVRTAERAISPSPSTMAYFVAGPDDEASASCARLFIEQGWLGENFVFQADGAEAPTSETHQALDQLVRSVHSRANGAAGLGHFLEQARQSGRRSCILFLPPGKGPWLQQLERLKPHLGQTTAIVGVDTVMASAKESTIRRALFHGGRQARASELAPVVRRLVDLGLATQVLHRPSGELIATSTLLRDASS